MIDDNKYKLRENRLLLAGLFLLYVIILPREYKLLDFEYWTNWALYIHKHGVTDVYNNTFMVDYHPIFLYVLAVFDKIQGTAFNIVQNMNYIKLFPLVFDFLPIVLFCCFKKSPIKQEIPFLFLLLNVAYLYSTMIWGQVDSVYVNLIFIAAIIGFRSPIWSGVLFAIALGTKLQAIIYLPLLVIVWVYSIHNIKTIIGVLVSIVATLFVIALPFIFTGNADKLLHVVTSAVGRYPNVSISGFNIWYLIYSGNPNHTIDTDTYFILSYKNWGFLLFFLFSGYTLLVALLHAVKEKLSTNNVEALMKMLMLTGALITLYFYYFNTQMHERYAHAMIIFFFFYGVFSKNYKLYILASIPYFLSLEKSFPDFLPIAHPKILFASKVIAILYTLTIGYAMYEFFRQYKLKQSFNSVKSLLQKRY